MSKLSRDQLHQIADTFVIDHGCPYAESLLHADNLRRRFGSYGINLTELSYLIEKIKKLHTETACPAVLLDYTHTPEWIDWVKDVQI